MKNAAPMWLFVTVTSALSAALGVVLIILFAVNSASEARDAAMKSRLDAQREVNEAQSDMLHALAQRANIAAEFDQASLKLLRTLDR